MGTTYWLPRLVGASRAAELLLTARIIDAREAVSIGLVTDVVPDAAADAPVAERPVVQRALETARAIRANPPFGTWMTKETMWQTIDAPSFRAALDIENRTQVMLSAGGAVQEAMAAFREKREPEWGPL